MKLETLLERTNTLDVAGRADVNVAGITHDSRQVRSGSVFVALPGLHVDGRDFIQDAVRRGAAAVVVEGDEAARGADCSVRVPDARLALAELAATFHGDPAAELEVIGITGTNGKTSTAYMVRDILRADGREPGMIGTVGYEIGTRTIPASRTTPEAPDLQSMLAQMRGAGCRGVVMEVSSHALSQRRVHAIDFDAAVFTNLTHDHLDYHGSMDKYFDAKSQLFRTLGGGGKPAMAAINGDDPRGRDMVAACGSGVQTVTFGSDPDADVRVENPRVTARGTAFTAASPWGKVSIQLPLPGRFNVANAAAALSVCGALGVDLERIGAALSEVSMVPGRLERVPTDRGFDVYVDYAHTDDALHHVLTTLREITVGRLWVIFGCGGDRDRGKRPAMGRVAAEAADRVLLTSDNPRSEEPAAIIDEILGGTGGASNTLVEVDRAAAIHAALASARKGDVLLIAGKGHENFQEFANRTLPFDDRQVVRDWLAGVTERENTDAGL